MTPEERAGAVVMDYHGKRCWGYDPVQHAEYEQLIADAIREAVTAERERCAKAVEDGYFLHETAPTARFANEVAAMLRRLT